MAIRIVRLGVPKVRGEGVRLGTVRRPPRGVPRSRYRSDHWYDVWLPGLAPSAGLVAFGRNGDPARWARFERRYRAEMRRPEAQHLLDLLAALSQRTNLSLGCYCEDERRCHRGILRGLLREHGARIVD